MPKQEQVREILNRIVPPGAGRGLEDMSLVKEIRVEGDSVAVTLASAAMSEGAQEYLKRQIGEEVGRLEGTGRVSIGFAEAIPKDINEVKNVIAVMSGKGGVGKSLVSGLVALSLRRRGHSVGILDADITGPSIPKMFGITERPAGSDTGILPVPSKTGIEVMSINLLLPNEDEAVIWRGPLIGKTITQFWENVLWGKLDYLVVDLPPGTADAPLTVMQTLPISGIIVVFTPQDLTAMIVKKAVNMAKSMKKPILGVVENMSYLYVPEIDKRIEIFGKSRGEEMARDAGAPLLAQLPIDPELAKLCDAGNIDGYDAEVIARLGEAITRATGK